MYTLPAHLELLRDPVRMPAHAEAIRAVVRPGDVVLDLGAGVGPLTFLALDAGAAHVYAVDSDDVVEVTRRVARGCGYQDRVTCIQCDVRHLELPGPVDVLVADIRGCLPVSGDNVESIAAARDRLLAPGGRLIPCTDRIFVAPVEHPRGFRDVDGWRLELASSDYSPVAGVAANQWRNSPFRSDALLAAGQPLPPLDYRRVQRADLSLSARFEVERRGRCHGLGAWFEAELAPGIGFSTAPSEPESVYGQALFPLLQEYEVEAGDGIEAEMAVRSGAGGAIWRWKVRLQRSGRPAVEEEHSTLDGQVVGREQLHRRADSHVPSLNVDGQIERLILERVDGRTSLGEIARELAARHPERFPSWQDALTRVGDLSVTYGE